MNKIITDLAVFEVTKNGLILQEVAEGSTLEDVRRLTEADFEVASNLGQF